MDRKAEPGSEVAALLVNIQEAYESAVLGLSGLASGTARHTFITARMERMSELQEDLRQLVGEGEAVALFAQTLERSVERPGP